MGRGSLAWRTHLIRTLILSKVDEQRVIDGGDSNPTSMSYREAIKLRIDAACRIGRVSIFCTDSPSQSAKTRRLARCQIRCLLSRRSDKGKPKEEIMFPKLSLSR
jgi:hypothetical protein